MSEIILNETVLKAEFDKAVSLFREKLTLDEDIKIIKEGLKSEGLETSDIQVMMQVAQAKAKDELEALDGKATKLKDALERFAG